MLNYIECFFNVLVDITVLLHSSKKGISLKFIRTECEESFFLCDARAH